MSFLVLQTAFAQHVEAFRPFLLASLDSHEDSQICMAAIGVLSVLCRNFGDKIFPLMDELMEKLLSILSVCIFFKK
jgi:hypothetical protein